MQVWISQRCQRHYAWMHTCNYLDESVPGVRYVRAKQIMCFFQVNFGPLGYTLEARKLFTWAFMQWLGEQIVYSVFCDDLRAEQLNRQRTVCLVCSEFKFEQVFRVEVLTVWFLKKSLSLHLYFEILNFKDNILWIEIKLKCKFMTDTALSNCTSPSNVSEPMLQHHSKPSLLNVNIHIHYNAACLTGWQVFSGTI